MSQDLAARILQKNLRIYLVKIKSDPQYEYKQMLKRKKMNILKNYNLVDNVRNNISGNNDKNNENDYSSSALKIATSPSYTTEKNSELNKEMAQHTSEETIFIRKNGRNDHPYDAYIQNRYFRK